MTTLPPPGTNEFPDSSIEKKVYGIVESLSDYIPISNDKNRLGFGLYKYITGEGDPPETLLKSTKIKIEGITLEDLAAKIKTKLEEVKQ
ncbi:MAG: hypothetical protein DRQ01_03625 [Ignavibacteriae bacterium]|nr:MAG: hypothetical protein DRQ01_03625 [Ignavibacteriota bacterium]